MRYSHPGDGKVRDLSVQTKSDGHSQARDGGGTCHKTKRKRLSKGHSRPIDGRETRQDTKI